MMPLPRNAEDFIAFMEWVWDNSPRSNGTCTYTPNALRLIERCGAEYVGFGLVDGQIAQAFRFGLEDRAVVIRNDGNALKLIQPGV